MEKRTMEMKSGLRSTIALAMAALLLPVGCKKATPAMDDPAITQNVESRFHADTALSSEPIQVYTQAGVVTLNGQVSNIAARSLAANDAATVPGVTKVINNILVAPSAPALSARNTPPPAPAPLPVERPREKVKPKRAVPPPPKAVVTPPPVQAPAPIERAEAHPAPAPPPPPPPPAFRNVTVPAGTVLPVRITQTLDSATAQSGDTFTGALAADITEDGLVVLPRGTSVGGRVVAAKDAGHFKGASQLSLQLTGISRHGQQIALSTDSFTKEGAARGKNTAVKTGVGAAAGALLGGIFGGGKGAAIGAAAGGGTGAGINAVTRGQQVQIPSETVVRFTTTNSISVRTPTGGERSGGDRSRSAMQDR